MAHGKKLQGGRFGFLIIDLSSSSKSEIEIGCIMRWSVFHHRLSKTGLGSLCQSYLKGGKVDQIIPEVSSNLTGPSINSVHTVGAQAIFAKRMNT